MHHRIEIETTMIESAANSIMENVRATVERFPSVVLAYLFGSVCKGGEGPLSDIDVAVLFENGDSKSALGDLQDALCRVLKTDRVDLVSLAQAPAALAYRVIRDGQCIDCRDKRVREAFESSTVMRYLDFKPVRERAFQIARQRILEAV